MFEPDVPTVTVDELPLDLETSAAVLLDCREDEEWRAGHIAGAVHVPMNSLPQRIAYDPTVLSPETPIVVVCKVGSRSAHVAAWLNQNGFDAVNLEGGMYAWAAAGRSMTSETGEAAYIL